MNYTELQAAVGSWLNRQDLSAVIPTFIALAEADFGRKIRHRRQVARATTQFDEHFILLPDDFVQAKNVQLNVDPVVTLEYVTLEHADLLRGGRYQGTGQPVYYTIVGDQLEGVPVPDSDYEIELTYYEKIDALSESVPSTWLSELHPDIYLYGALLQSAPFLKDDARVPIWDGLYQRAIEALNLESDRAEISGATLIARTLVQW